MTLQPLKDGHMELAGEVDKDDEVGAGPEVIALPEVNFEIDIGLEDIFQDPVVRATPILNCVTGLGDNNGLAFDPASQVASLDPVGSGVPSGPGSFGPKQFSVGKQDCAVEGGE